MNNNLLDITRIQPFDGERVLVWDNYYGEFRILTYNENEKCWDTEDGDDFEFSVGDVLPQEPYNLRVQYWTELPEEPIK